MNYCLPPFDVWASNRLTPGSLRSYMSYIRKVEAVTGYDRDWIASASHRIELAVAHNGLTPKQTRDGRSALRMYSEWMNS